MCIAVFKLRLESYNPGHIVLEHFSQCHNSPAWICGSPSPQCWVNQFWSCIASHCYQHWGAERESVPTNVSEVVSPEISLQFGVVLIFVWKMDLLIFQHNIRNPYLLWIHKNLLYSLIIHRFPLKERIIPYLQKSGKNRVIVFSKTNYGALFCLSLSKVAYIIFLRLWFSQTEPLKQRGSSVKDIAGSGERLRLVKKPHIDNTIGLN